MQAISFDVGVKWSSATLWYGADLSDGSFDSNQGSGFTVSNSGIERFGMYVMGSNDACTSMTRIIIDPTSSIPNWGVGGLTFYENPDCTSVPEPGSLSLLGAGLIGFGLLWRFRKRDARLA